MGLFKCDRCGGLENTALGAYWGHAEKLCSECASGTWHGKFEQRPWDPTRDHGYVDGQFLAPSEVAATPEED